MELQVAEVQILFRHLYMSVCDDIQYNIYIIELYEGVNSREKL